MSSFSLLVWIAAAATLQLSVFLGIGYRRQWLALQALRARTGAGRRD